MGIISSKQSYRTGVSMGSRSQDLGHFLDYCFYEVFSYKLTLYKDYARELSRVSGDWSVRVIELIRLIRKRLRRIIWGKHSISEFAHHLTTEVGKLPRTTTVYNVMAKIIFLSHTYHVWHQIVLLDINFAMYSQIRLTPFSFS